jgi:hypothetical protein
MRLQKNASRLLHRRGLSAWLVGFSFFSGILFLTDSSTNRNFESDYHLQHFFDALPISLFPSDDREVDSEGLR